MVDARKWLPALALSGFPVERNDPGPAPLPKVQCAAALVRMPFRDLAASDAMHTIAFEASIQRASDSYMGAQ